MSASTKAGASPSPVPRGPAQPGRPVLGGLGGDDARALPGPHQSGPRERAQRLTDRGAADAELLHQGRLTGQPGADRPDAAGDLLAQPGGGLFDQGARADGAEDHAVSPALLRSGTSHRNRTPIARTLMPEPRLLLLDGPAAGLDLPGRERLLTALDALRRTGPRLATVLVTQHPEELPAGTSHARLLRDGRAPAPGPAAGVLTSDQVGKCFGLPLTLERHGGRRTVRVEPRPREEGALDPGPLRFTPGVYLLRWAQNSSNDRTLSPFRSRLLMIAWATVSVTFQSPPCARAVLNSTAVMKPSPSASIRWK